MTANSALPRIARRHLILSIAVVSLGTSAHAATADLATEPPADKIIISQAQEPTSGIQLRNQNTSEGTEERMVGVSFVATDDADLKSVSVMVSKVGSGIAGAEMTVSLVNLEALGSTPASPLAPVQTETLTLPTDVDVPKSGAYLTVTLETPWKLQAGQAYGIVFAFKEPANGRRLNFSTSGGGNDSIGYTFYTSDGGSTYKTVNPANLVLQSS